MPPKKEGTPAPAAAAPAPGDGAAPAAAAPPPPPEEKVDGKQLWNATDALQKAKAMRNYFQLERDKITAFWEISKRELEATKSELRQKDREKAEKYERHQVEVKVYKQKMRHVLYENQVQLAQMKMESERTLKNKQEEHREKEDDLRRDCRSLKVVGREEQLLERDTAAALVEQHDRHITDQQREFERQQKEMHLKYEKKIKNLRDEMERTRKDDISVIEKRKDDHVNELRELHDKAFQEIKDYYNEITSNNLETIRTLKDEVYSRKRTEAHNEKAMFDIAQTNKRLTEPLTKAQKQKKQLEQELSSYARDKAALRTAKQELRELEQRVKTLLWEHEVLGQRYAKLTQDRDLIFDRYNSMLQEVQQKAVFKRVLVHKKIDVVSSQLERKDAQLTEILKQANVDPAAIQGVERKVDDLLADKNRSIEELQQLLAALTQRHEKVSMAYETYLRQNGVPGLDTNAGAANPVPAR